MVKNFKLALLACASAVLFGSPAFAGERYNFDQTHSKIDFEIHHLLGDGKRRFSSVLRLDQSRSGKSGALERVSAHRGGEYRYRDQKTDHHLRSADFFDVAKFPEITFQSRSVKRTGEQSADVAGDFTMHGRTRPIVLHVQLLSGASGDRSRWEVTTAPLKRRDFDLVFGGNG